MQRALYYPHSVINDRALMKSALLLWDEVEVISPNDNFIPEYADRELAEAAEIVVKHRPPTEDDRRTVEARIFELADKAPPEWLLYRKSAEYGDYDTYRIYKDKLTELAIRHLADKGLVGFPASDPQDFSTHTSLGLIIMGILAKERAGTLKEMVTDRFEQYAALGKYITFLSDGRWLGDKLVNLRTEVGKVLITTSLKIIDPRGISFEKLVALRKDEGRHEGSFRQSYAKAIRDYVGKVSAATTPEDIDTIVSSFEAHMRGKAAELEQKLKIRAGQAVLSREMLVAVVASAAALPSVITPAGPIAAGVIGTGALGKLWLDYRADRDKILAENPMGFLYKSKRFPIY